MTWHKITYSQPLGLDYNRFATNGRLVNAGFFNRCANNINHIATTRRKVFGTIVSDPNSPLTFDTGTHWDGGTPQEKCSGSFRTGPATTQIVIDVCFAKTRTTAADIRPGVRLEFDGGPEVTDSAYSVIESGTGEPVVADELHWAEIRHTVTVNTAYEWVLQGWDEARVLYATIYESRSLSASDARAGVVDPTGFQVHNPILASHAGDLVDANNSLIKYAGAHLLDHNGEETYARTSATYASIWTALVYKTIWWQNKHTRKRELDILFAVDGILGSAGAGGCRLRDTSDTRTVAEVTSFTTSRAWHTVQTTVDSSLADSEDIEVQIKGDGSAQLTIYGYALYIYDP